MTRLFAISLACLILFATSGAHRAAAAWFQTSVIAVKTTPDMAVVRAKAPCCKSYKVHKDTQLSACNLPLVMLPSQMDIGSPGHTGEDWPMQDNSLYRGHLCGPGEQPPKMI